MALSVLEDLKIIDQPCAMKQFKILHYDTDVFNFKKIMETEIFQVLDLADLHTELEKPAKKQWTGKDNFYFRDYLKKK